MEEGIEFRIKMDEKIPTNSQALTTEWLTDALRETNTISRANVKSFNVSALGNEKGITGQLVRLTLNYDTDEEKAPQSLIAKFPTTNPEELEIMFAQTYMYEREVRFYQKIAARTKLRTPRCYYSAINVEAREYILLLEDLAPIQSGDWVAGCTVEQAEIAIRQIAKFHATWWESPELAKMTWMPQYGAAQFVELGEEYRQAWEPFRRKMGHNLPESMLEIGERLGQHLVSVLSHFQEPPRTIVHADYQLDNLFFMPSESEFPLVVADWQLLMFGRGVFDVAHFLGANLVPKDRTKKGMELLSIYHALLVAYGIKDYTFDQCLYDYRLSMLYSLARFVIVIGFVLMGEQEQNACNVIVPRYIAAILDLNAGELLPK